MTAPKHLWSGDWEQESDAHGDELARRSRLRAEQPADAPPPLPDHVISVPAPPGPTLGARLLALLTTLGRALVAILRVVGLLVIAIGRGLRAAFAALRRAAHGRRRVAVIAALLVAAVAIAAVALLSSGGSSPASANDASPAAVRAVANWLGVQFSVQNGAVVIETVNPTGVAANAGFEPGDILSQIDSRSIDGLGDVQKAFRTVAPGDQISITATRGSGFYSASFPMPPRPSGGP